MLNYHKVVFTMRRVKKLEQPSCYTGFGLKENLSFKQPQTSEALKSNPRSKSESLGLKLRYLMRIISQ